MTFARIFSKAGQDPDQSFGFRTEAGEDLVDYIVPKSWNRAACAVLISDVFYKTALPSLTRRVPEDGVPEWLWRSEVDETGLDTISAEWRYRFEKDIRDVLHRVAGCLAYHAFKAGLFESDDDAKVFYDELRALILTQAGSLEIAVLAHAGLDWAYGLQNAPAWQPQQRISSFTGSIDDTGGIYIPVTSPDKNILSKINLLTQTRAVHGVTQRTSIMMPVENIDSMGFSQMRRKADIDDMANNLGRRMIRQAFHHVMDACDRDSVVGFDPARNLRLARALEDAKASGVDEQALLTAIDYARQGFEDIELPGGDNDTDASSAGITPVLSIPDAFIETALTGHGFLQYEAGEPKRHVSASKLWDKIAEAIWSSGVPEISFRDSSRPRDGLEGHMGRSATGGFVFFPDTQGVSASLNLLQFTGNDGVLATDKLRHAVRLLMLASDAAIDAAGLNDKTRKLRPVVIGVTNIAATLMSHALPYDSDAGRAVGALSAAFVTGACLEMSADMARRKGSFDGYALNEKAFLQSIKDKIAALAGTSFLQIGMTRRPAAIRPALSPDKQLITATAGIWEKAYAAGRDKGYRHAHVTGIDTDTRLQALLGAQTRDITPEAALVRFESYFSDTLETAELYGKKLNPVVTRALATLGYNAQQIDDIHFYAVGHGTLFDAPAINHATLRARGFHQAALDALEAGLKTAHHIRYVFNKWTLGADFCRHMLGFDDDALESGTFDMLQALGFTEDDIDDANLYCCGTMAMEGAPHLKVEHLPVFDCIAPAGIFAVRRIACDAHIKMQAAIEPFLSGGIAHTVELSSGTDIADVQKLILAGWEMGLKNLRIFRQESSLHMAATHAETSENADEETFGMHMQRVQAAS